MSKEKKPTFSNVHEALAYVQREIKAPKGQYNQFGKYKYRSCEDITEAAKKVMPEGAIVTLTDSVQEIAGRVYVIATASFLYGGEKIDVHAHAREPENKKGMDESQITGATSSYARKYALNGLFLIDDTKDADTQDNTSEGKEKRGTTRQAIADTKVKKATETYEKMKSEIDGYDDMDDLVDYWNEHTDIVSRLENYTPEGGKDNMKNLITDAYKKRISVLMNQPKLAAE